MFMDSSSPIISFFGSPETKFYLSLAAGAWAASKGFTWVKEIRDKDLKGISTGMTTLKHEVRGQTDVIGNGFHNLQNGVESGFRELRDDFRTFYTAPDPIMVPVHARAARKKASVVTRTQAKARTAPKKSSKK